MAGRPRKTETVEEEAVQMADVVEYASVKQLIRKISTQGMSVPNLGIDSIYDVDKDVAAWVDAGYTLKDPIFLGTDPAGSFNVLYILVKSS